MAAFRPLQNEKTASEHILLTVLRLKEPVWKHFQCGWVYICKNNLKIMQQATIVVNIFISQCYFGSVIFFIFEENTCFFATAAWLINPVSLKSSTSPSLPCLAQCRIVRTSAKCCHRGCNREITGLVTTCSVPGHSKTWARRNSAPESLVKSQKRHFQLLQLLKWSYPILWPWDLTQWFSLLCSQSTLLLIPLMP